MPVKHIHIEYELMTTVVQTQYNKPLKLVKAEWKTTKGEPVLTLKQTHKEGSQHEEKSKGTDK